jgi:hypothetical protein
VMQAQTGAPQRCHAGDRLSRRHVGCNDEQPGTHERGIMDSGNEGASGGRLALLSVAIVIVLIAGFAPARAQEGTENRGTEEQRLACTGDVFRLCGSEIPNVSRIVACLLREKPRLSAGCRMVFDQNSPRVAGKSRKNHRVLLAQRRNREQEPEPEPAPPSYEYRDNPP